jgi:hypothetical protein
MTTSSCVVRHPYVVEKTTTNCSLLLFIVLWSCWEGKDDNNVIVIIFFFSFSFFDAKKTTMAPLSCHHRPLLLLCRHEKMTRKNCTAHLHYVMVLLQRRRQ